MTKDKNHEVRISRQTTDDGDIVYIKLQSMDGTPFSEEAVRTALVEYVQSLDELDAGPDLSDTKFN